MTRRKHRFLDWVTRKWLTESDQKTASVEKVIREGRTDPRRKP